MVQGFRALRGKPIEASDGALGFIVDVYFDDATWKVRYLVLDTGRPMPQRQVLLSAAQAQWREADRRVHVGLTRRQVEKCRPLDEDRPVYLQHDIASVTSAGDRHLRSAEAVLGCAVRRPGGAGGRLKDIEVETEGWTIADFVVERALWLLGRRSFVAPAEVAGIDWIEHSLELYPRKSVAPRIAP